MQTLGPSAEWRALHGLLLLLLLPLPFAIPSLMQWPSYLLVPLLVYGIVVGLVPALQRTCQWFAVGRFDRGVILATLGTMVISSAALILYQAIVGPDLASLAAQLPVQAFGNLALAGICFAILNAFLEEAIFRGVFYDALESQWGWPTAVVATAAIFGVIHGNGYPQGLLGKVMAAIYGLLLGLLRRQSHGLMAPTLAHVCADATIFGIFAYTGAFQPSVGT